MAEYIDTDGNKFWYEEHGGGEPLVLFHPGGADSRAFESLLDSLDSKFHVYLIDRRGHGRTADTEGALTFAQSATDMAGFIENIIKEPAHILGYSDGAVVAIQLTHQRPDLVKQVVCVSGVFNKDGWRDGVLVPGQEPPEFMAESYGQVSPDGKEHYAVIARKLDDMHSEGPNLTTDDLRNIAVRTLVLMGDDDEIKLDHAESFARSLQKGELAIIPGTSHGVLVEKSTLCAQIVVSFLTEPAIDTFAPIYRADD